MLTGLYVCRVRTVHGSFLQHCLEKNIFFRDQVIGLHDGPTKMLVTSETRQELLAQGPSHSAAAVVVKRIENVKYVPPPITEAAEDVENADDGPVAAAPPDSTDGVGGEGQPETDNSSPADGNGGGGGGGSDDENAERGGGPGADDAGEGQDDGGGAAAVDDEVVAPPPLTRSQRRNLSRRKARQREAAVRAAAEAAARLPDPGMVSVGPSSMWTGITPLLTGITLCTTSAPVTTLRGARARRHDRWPTQPTPARRTRCSRSCASAPASTSWPCRMGHCAACCAGSRGRSSCSRTRAGCR
jgi:hypothetical protein